MLKLFKFIYFYLRNFKYIFISNKRIFENIYKKNEWGTNNKSQFYSGSGSHDDSYITNYINTINSFISNKNYTVIDFGTGDFNISKHIAPNAKKFVGIDIVKPLINHLKSKYSSEKIDFCVYKNEILDADVILVKEVFQHLSNQKISKILSQIKCKHLIVTEKVPLNKGLPNIDKPSSCKY